MRDQNLKPKKRNKIVKNSCFVDSLCKRGTKLKNLCLVYSLRLIFATVSFTRLLPIPVLSDCHVIVLSVFDECQICSGSGGCLPHLFCLEKRYLIPGRGSQAWRDEPTLKNNKAKFVRDFFPLSDPGQETRRGATSP